MIDIKTFMLVLAIGHIGFAMLMAGYARIADSHPAMRIWMWAKLVQGAAHLLGWLRPDLAIVPVVVLSNVCLLSGIALEVGAYATFFGLRWLRTLAPITLLALLVFQSARAGGASAGALTALMSMLIAGYNWMTAWIMLRRRGSLLQRIIGLNALLFFAVLSARAAVALQNDSWTAFTPGLVQSLTYLTGYVLMIVNGFGFLLLCKEQDDRKMEELATTDSLTGLVNRRAFFERTAAARQLAARLRKPIALMMLDVDHFKRLNDRFGHATGDEALCVFARAAEAALREVDIMARLGGEEFAVVLPGTDLAGALQAAERLRAAVECAPLLTDGNHYTLTVSVGVAAIDPEEHINAALARADHALYAAKSNGRNRVECGENVQPLPLRQRVAVI